MGSDVRDRTSKRRTEMFLLNLPTQCHEYSPENQGGRETSDDKVDPDGHSSRFLDEKGRGKLVSG